MSQTSSLIKSYKADKLKEKYVAEIEARIEDIKRVEKIGAETEIKTTSKRKATKVISWLDAKLAPEKTSSTGPGCSICISTFEEIQAEGKTLKSTPCGHIFCAECLEMSANHSKQCPKCRKKILLKRCHPIFPDLLG